MSTIQTDGFKSYLDSLPREDKLVRKAAFLSILENQPASVAEIAKRSGLDLKTASATTKKLLDSGLMVANDAGEVVGSWGLTLVPSNHHIVVDSKDLYTWCAEDIVGIPAALGIDAKIESACYQCGNPLTIEMKKGNVASASEKDIHLWIAEAEVGRSIVENF